MQFLQAAGTVVAHAGHDDAQGVAAGKFGDRAKEHVHRGLVAVDERTVGDFHDVLRAAALEQHVSAPRGDQGAPWYHTVAVARLADFDLAQAVESFGKHGGELLRHVLHDDDAQTGGGQAGEDGFQCLCAAGRGADGDQLIGRAGHGARGARREHGVHADFRAVLRRAGGCLGAGQGAQVGAGSGAHGLDDVVG